jgi:hypothetical protein
MVLEKPASAGFLLPAKSRSLKRMDAFKQAIHRAVTRLSTEC